DFLLRSGIDASGFTAFRAVGCDHCHGTGYSGRLAISELLIPTEEVRSLMVQGAPSHSIQNAAVKSGMRTLWEDGLDKVRAGQTTLDEVLQAVRPEGI
ncbi:MAG: type II secretion system protein GspE, partial [Phycisphaerae bacterium]|nr:type II secretion system protein GspE [Phycisphaerae bacterium]